MHSGGNVIKQLKNNAVNLLRISKAINNNPASSIISAAQKTLERTTFHLAVLGEFKRGKTSLVNSILGDNYLPTDVLPNTAIITVIEYGKMEACNLTWEDGRKEEWQMNIDSLKRLGAEGDIDASKIRHLILTLDNPILKDGLVIIDTPGVNDISQSRVEVTNGILPHCDAALFLLDAAAPITRSEADFLTTKVLNHKIDELLFIISKADRLNDNELNESIEGAQSRIKEVLGHSRKVITYSSINVAIQKEQGEILTDLELLIEQILPLREKATIDKTKRVISNLKLAIDMILDELESIFILTEADDEQVRQIQERISIEQTEFKTRFERLKTSIEMVGRQTLLKMVDKSITRFFENLKHDLENQIRMQDQNVEAFFKRVLPVQIERSLRQFSEGKASEIKAYIDRFVSHLAEEYTKNFKVPLKLNMEQTGLDMPDWKSSVANDEDSPINKILSNAGPLAVGAIVGSFIAPGIGTLIGGQAGQILGMLSNKKQNDAKITECISQLPTMIDEIQSHFMNHSSGVINNWFNSMLNALEKYHMVQQGQMNSQIENRLAKPSENNSQFNKEQLAAYKQEIMEIYNTLNSKE